MCEKRKNKLSNLYLGGNGGIERFVCFGGYFYIKNIGGMKMEMKRFLPINLNFFGESEGGEGQGGSGGETAAADLEKGVSPGGENKEPEEKNEDNDTSQLDKLIQDAAKRENKKLADENRKLTKALEKLQKEKLSEDELKQLEIENKIAEITERERQVTEKENRLYAIKAIKAAGLDDGSENSLELIDFVMGAAKEEIDSKVKIFGGLINKFVKAEVDRTFKENGRIPGKGTNEDRGGNENNIAVQLGKMSASAKEKSRNVIDAYLK